MEKRSFSLVRYKVFIDYFLLAWAFFGLYMLSIYNFNLFHSLAELFIIVIGTSVFITIWNVRRFLTNHYFLFLSISFLFVCIFDAAHMLSFLGVPLSIDYDKTNLAFQSWIVGRFIQSVAFLAAPIFIRRKIKPIAVFTVFGAVTAIILLSIFYWKIFPVAFAESKGLTLFGMVSEFVFSLIFLVSAAFLIKKREAFSKEVLWIIVVSVITLIVSELFFVSGGNVSISKHLIAIMLRIVAFLLIYKATIVASLAKPYELIFRELKQSEEALREAGEKYRDFIDNFQGIAYRGIISTFKPVFFEGAVEEITGYTAKEFTEGKLNWKDLILPEDLAKIRESIEKIKTRPNYSVEREYRIRRKDGSVRWVLERIHNVCDLAGKCLFVQGVIFDNTSHKKIEEELAGRTEELEKMNKFMVGRELKMSELKNEIAELKRNSKNRAQQ